MPNYGLKTVYQPFTFQERIAPLQILQQEYNAVEQGLSALGDEANQYSQLIDPQSRSGQELASYNRMLDDTAQKLSSEGLKSVSRNTLFALRRQYNGSISKINQAAKSLGELLSTTAQMRSKDPTLMSGYMPSVDDLVDNPSAAPQLVSGTTLYAQGTAAAKAASSRLQGPMKVYFNDLAQGYIHTVQEQGYDSEAAQKFMADASSIPELKQAMEQIRKQYSTDTLSDPSKADEFIMRGLLDGMTYERKDDLKYDQYAAASLKANRNTSLNDVPLIPENTYSQRERSADAKYLDKMLKGNMISKNDKGYYYIDQKGLDSMKEWINSDHTPSGVPSAASTMNAVADRKSADELKNFLERNNIDTSSVEAFNSSLNNYIDSMDRYDANRTTDWGIQIEPADQKAWLYAIIGTQSGKQGKNGVKKGIVPEIDWNPEEGTYDNIGDLHVSDIDPDKWYIDRIVVGDDGSIYAKVFDDGKKLHRIRINGINSGLEENAGRNRKEMTTKQQDIKSTVVNWIAESTGKSIESAERYFDDYIGSMDVAASVLAAHAAKGDSKARKALKELNTSYTGFMTAKAAMYNNLTNLIAQSGTKDTNINYSAR